MLESVRVFVDGVEWTTGFIVSDGAIWFDAPLPRESVVRIHMSYKDVPVIWPAVVFPVA
jgi:hypothetical protein